MSAEIRVELDVREFVQRMELSAREVINAMRRTVDKTARAARKDAIKVMAADIGVPVAKFRDAVPPVKATRQGNLTATWTISKKAIGILNTGTFAPVLDARRGSFSGSTFKLTGGGSSSLSIGKVFILEANGGRALMVRTGPGKSAFKPIYTEMPSTSMSQSDGAPRKDWQRVADATLGPMMSAEIQKALDGQTGPAPGSIGGDQ